MLDKCLFHYEVSEGLNKTRNTDVLEPLLNIGFIDVINSNSASIYGWHTTSQALSHADWAAQNGMCACSVTSLVSDSLWPYGLQPASLLCPWDFPGKNTGVGCHFLLQDIFPTQGHNPCLLHLLHCRQILYRWATGEAQTNL